MNRRILPLIFSVMFSLFLPLPLKAEEGKVLEKIKRTGLLTVAIRADAAPFGYREQSGNWSGFCFDIIDKIADKVKENLGREAILVEVYKSTLFNRFDLVADGIVELECGPNTIQNYSDSAKRINFSLPFWVTGIQFLIAAENAPNIDVNANLKGIKIGVQRYTTTQETITRRYPEATLQFFQGETGSRRGVQAVQQRRIDAFVGDGTLLFGEAIIQGLSLGKDYLLVPEIPLDCEYYGLVLPKGDSQWEELVNTVVKEEKSQKVYEKWFGISLVEILEKTRDFCRSKT